VTFYKYYVVYLMKARHLKFRAILYLKGLNWVEASHYIIFQHCLATREGL